MAIQRGDGEAALREARLEPNEGYRRFELALAHYARGDRPAADAALAELIAKDRDVMAYQIAEVYAWRGEKDKAFEWLQVSLDNHDTGMLSLLIDPLMRGLHHDARYNSLLAKIGLPTAVMSGLARTETDAPDAPCYTPTFKARRWMRQKRRSTSATMLSRSSANSLTAAGS